MATLNPQAWATPQVVIATPPNAMIQETNQYLQELKNLHLGLANIAAFTGLQNNVNLPNMPVVTLGPNTTQATIDTQIATLDLYRAMLMNAQGVIVQLMSPTVQNPQTPRSTIKALNRNSMVPQEKRLEDLLQHVLCTEPYVPG